MSDLTQEVFDTLPEPVQGNYELSGEVYVTKDSLKVAALKASLDGACGQRDEVSAKLSAYEQSKADEIKAAEQAAYDKALADNDFETINKTLQEKLEDAERRNGESQAKFDERMGAIAKDKEAVIISELTLNGSEVGKSALKRLLSGYVKVDPETGTETYLNDDGSASSLDKKQFIESLKTNELFKPLLRADIVTTGGGLANGSQDSGGDSDGVNEKAEAAKKAGDVMGFLKAKL